MSTPGNATAPPRPPLPPSARRPPAIAAGGYSRPLVGFVECGDFFVIQRLPPAEPAENGERDDRGDRGALLLAVIDGLGHGREAGVAAQAAARAVLDHRRLPLAEILRYCDRELHPTRGAAMGVLRLEEDGRGEFCGIGNVEVQSLAGQPPGLFCLPGIVGHNLRTLRTMPFVMQNGDIYCLHTDGVSSRGDLRGCLPGSPEAVARCIVDGWGRQHDDATAVVLGFGAAAGNRLPAAPGAAGAGPRTSLT
jgi:negative regulator of sigma-B (phosphoserine phosphatase)